MCGITGAIWTDPKRAIDSPTLRAMTDVIRHRGPDDEGSYVSEFRLRPPYEPMPGVALGFRRLSIIDLEGGHQHRRVGGSAPVERKDHALVDADEARGVGLGLARG